ncbi:hypothetical protein HOC80_03385 [archaeon]|mgnify:CR=1 FL=1|jgi:hypothetical protein|nr:hypothetical protein [archaeon]MBT4417120.1 hypothetical protein [archaeon]
MEKILVVAQERKVANTLAEHFIESGQAYSVDIAVTHEQSMERFENGRGYDKVFVDEGACLARAASKHCSDVQLFEAPNIYSEEPLVVLNTFKPYDYKAPEEELGWEALALRFHENGYAIENLPGSQRYFEDLSIERNLPGSSREDVEVARDLTLGIMLMSKGLEEEIEHIPDTGEFQAYM